MTSLRVLRAADVIKFQNYLVLVKYRNYILFKIDDQHILFFFFADLHKKHDKFVGPLWEKDLSGNPTCNSEVSLMEGTNRQALTAF